MSDSDRTTHPFPAVTVGDGGGRFKLPAPRRSAPAWSEEWPTEPGRYWFYGYRDSFDIQQGRPRLATVDIRRGGSGSLFTVTDGAFLYRAEGARGLWLPLAEPELPDWSGK